MKPPQLTSTSRHYQWALAHLEAGWISDCVPGEGVFLCSYNPRPHHQHHHHHQHSVSYKLNHLTYYGNEIAHAQTLRKLTWTISISAPVGTVNTCSDTWILFIRSETLLRCAACNWDFPERYCCQISQMGFIIGCNELFKPAWFPLVALKWDVL